MLFATTTRRACLQTALAVASLASVAAAVTLVPYAGAKTPLAIGQPAPDFAAVDTAGKPIKLADLKGKTVVLEWTNHDCPYVVKHYVSGNMQAIQKDAAKDGVVWLSIISSAPGEQGHVAPKKADDLTRSRAAAPAAVLLDPEGKIGRQYDARTTPHMFVIDKAGLLQYMGGIDDRASSNKDDVKSAKPYVRLALASVTKGEKVADAVTKPYGCSVKYR
jgi:alkyl hydroperoxide reductase subunit AhpC